MSFSKDDLALAERNQHITTEEIRRDISDTEADIARWQDEAKHLAKTPLSLPTARWDHMRADARLGYIKEATEFIEKLKLILKVRGEEV